MIMRVLLCLSWVRAGMCGDLPHKVWFTQRHKPRLTCRAEHTACTLQNHLEKKRAAGSSRRPQPPIRLPASRRHAAASPLQSSSNLHIAGDYQHLVACRCSPPCAEDCIEEVASMPLLWRSGCGWALPCLMCTGTGLWCLGRAGSPGGRLGFSAQFRPPAPGADHSLLRGDGVTGGVKCPACYTPVSSRTHVENIFMRLDAVAHCVCFALTSCIRD